LGKHKKACGRSRAAKHADDQKHRRDEKSVARRKGGKKKGSLLPEDYFSERKLIRWSEKAACSYEATCRKERHERKKTTKEREKPKGASFCQRSHYSGTMPTAKRGREEPTIEDRPTKRVKVHFVESWTGEKKHTPSLFQKAYSPYLLDHPDRGFFLSDLPKKVTKRGQGDCPITIPT